MKTCSKCKIEKTLEAFAVDRSKRDGRKTQCKECVAAKAKASYSSEARAKAYLAASPQARSRRTIRDRNNRWNNLAAKHGERWIIQQVQSLKAGAHLSWEAIDRAEKDERLAAFFRQVKGSSPDVLRTALNAALWDEVRNMSMSRADWVGRTMALHAHAKGDKAARLRSMYEKKWPGLGMRRIREGSDDAPSICENAPDRAQQRIEASNRILRKK